MILLLELYVTFQVYCQTGLPSCSTLPQRYKCSQPEQSQIAAREFVMFVDAVNVLVYLDSVSVRGCFPRRSHSSPGTDQISEPELTSRPDSDVPRIRVKRRVESLVPEYIERGTRDYNVRPYSNDEATQIYPLPALWIDVARLHDCISIVLIEVVIVREKVRVPRTADCHSAQVRL